MMHPMAGYCALLGLTPMRYVGHRTGKAQLQKEDTGIRIRDVTIKKLPMHLACLEHGFAWHMASSAQINHYKEIAWEEVSVIYLERLSKAVVDDFVRHNDERR